MLNFLTNKQAAEKIEGLEARVAELEAEAASAQAQIEAFKTSESDLSEKVSNLTTANADLSSQLEAITGERDQAQASLVEATAKLEGFDERVEAGVLARFESMGGSPLPISTEEALTETQIREKFATMKAGPERTAFFKANKSILSIKK